MRFFVYVDNLPGVLGFTGNSFADFLVGVPYLGVTFQGTGRAPLVARSVYGAYVQDNWRISRRLTINAGLRYEYAQRWRDADHRLNRLGTLDTSALSRDLGGRFLLAGSPDYYLPGTGVISGSGPPLIRASLIDPSWRDFQPRIGLAYRPFDDNKTAIRAGFGIYYALPDANSVAQELTSPPRFRTRRRSSIFRPLCRSASRCVIRNSGPPHRLPAQQPPVTIHAIAIRISISGPSAWSANYRTTFCLRPSIWAITESTIRSAY